MTYFKNIKTGRIYRVNLRHKNALIMSKAAVGLGLRVIEMQI